LFNEGRAIMTNLPDIPNKKANQYLFGGVGAVLGGAIGAGVAGLATAAVGAVLGGLVGYNLLTRVGKQGPRAS
jgi:osmotically inducible lipoprotein OsmB